MNYRQHKTFPYLEGKIQKRGAFVSISHPLTFKKGVLSICNVTSPFLRIRLRLPLESLIMILSR